MPSCPPRPSLPPPADAPPGFALSGRFTGPATGAWSEPGSVPGTPARRRTAAPDRPFAALPRPAGAGLLRHQAGAGDGAYWVLTDNGFGNQPQQRRRAADAPPLRPDWRAGTVAVERTIFLRDPNRVVPFPIVTDPSPTRFLTGADFDIESIQPVADGFWIGDEFGPYLIRSTREGRVTASARRGWTGERCAARTIRPCRCRPRPSRAVAFRRPPLRRL